MGEILFRGKRVDNGEWVYGDLIRNDNEHFPMVLIGQVVMSRDKYTDKPSFDGYELYEVIPETVGQYTRLVDKNGTKIFDGDVVHYVYEPLGDNFWNANQNCIIEWKGTGFYLNGIMGTNLYACVSGWLVSIPIGDGELFEVIGNIHDNSDLIEGVN